MTPAYQQAVDRKVAEAEALIRSGRQPDGWSQGPERIIREIVSETTDCAGWARGLDQYDIPDEVRAHVHRAVEYAAEAYTECQQALRRLDRG